MSVLWHFSVDVDWLCWLLTGMVQDVRVKWPQKQTMAFVPLVLPLSPVLAVCS